jgi:LptD protein
VIEFELEAQTDSVSLGWISPVSSTISPDSLEINIDSTLSTTLTTEKRSGIDSVLTYSALDTIVFNFRTKIMRLRGEAKLDTKEQKLAAETIEIKFTENIMKAYGDVDSAGNAFGVPHFEEGGEEYVGEVITYNYKTNKGLIKQGETGLEEGYYYGSTIKRVSTTEFYIKDGFYTPCEEAEPSAYFGSGEMKMLGKDYIFLDPLTFYLMDIPILMYPFGIFISSKSGRQSGILVPTYDFSQSRGVVFRDFGFYFAASDYWDTQITSDYFSKGGYLVKNDTRIKVGTELNANINMQYGKTRYNVEEDYKKAYSLNLNGNYQITPDQRVTAKINYSTSDFNRLTQTTLSSRIQQEIVSNASYSIKFDKFGTANLKYNANQNIINDTYTQSTGYSWSMPNKKLFTLLGQDFNLTLTDNFNMNFDKKVKIESREITAEGFEGSDSTYFVKDSTFEFVNKKKWSHNPGITFNFPKIFYQNFSPTIRLGFDNYFRRVERQYIDGELEELPEQSGFFTEWQWSAGLGWNTRLYGISKPDILGVKALRHTFEPKLNYTFRPDMSDPSFDLFGRYTDDNGKEQLYSYYQKDGGGSAPRKQSQSIGFNLNNTWELKYSSQTENDETGENSEEEKEAENYKLLTMNFSGNYDMERDSMKLSDIRANFNTQTLKFLNFNGGAVFSAYDLDEIRDEETGNISRYNKVNRSLFSENKFPLRMTSFNISLSTSVSDKGLSLEEDHLSDQARQSADSTESEALGGRFLNRMNRKKSKYDMFGDSSPGWTPLSLPWSLSMGVNYRKNLVDPLNDDEDLNANLNMRLTIAQKWEISSAVTYNFTREELSTPRITLNRDLDCWSMSFNWTPTGPNRAFYFRIGLKSSTMQDFKYEKKDYSIYR